MLVAYIFAMIGTSRGQGLACCGREAAPASACTTKLPQGCAASAASSPRRQRACNASSSSSGATVTTTCTHRA